MASPAVVQRSTTKPAAPKPAAIASAAARSGIKPAVRAKGAPRRAAASHSMPAWDRDALLATMSERLQPIAIRGRSARTSIASALDAYPSDDRSALALLLLPFLIVAVSLGTSQTWRQTINALPEIAIQAPFSVPRAAPTVAYVPPVQMVPRLTPPGTLQYPTSAPPISVASLDIQQSGSAAPPQVDIAGWSPPLPGWHDRLAAPPTVDVASLDLAPARPISPPIATGPTATPTDLCQASPTQLAGFASTGRLSRAPRMPLADASDPVAFGLILATAARAQTRDLVIYSARYHPMAYPMGDMPSFFGACTDVIIRAYRAAGIDLQEQVQRTHAGRGDTNIDHRRTETLRVLFSRAGASLAITRFPEDYKPGDVVTYHRPFSRVSASHIAMVSDVLAPSGRPMIVHNRGWGPQLEDALFVDRITGHYRYFGPAAAPASTAAAEQAAVSPRNLVRASFPGSAVLARRLGRASETTQAGPAPKAH